MKIKVSKERLVEELALYNHKALIKYIPDTIELEGEVVEEKKPYVFSSGFCAVCKQNKCYCPERQPDGSWVENKIEKLELASAERNWESADIRDKINEIINWINTHGTK